jgi:hypothetical protein
LPNIYLKMNTRIVALTSVHFFSCNIPRHGKLLLAHRQQEVVVSNQLKADDLITYIKEGYNPETLIGSLLSSDETLKDYGKCTEIAGSLWAFLGSALYKVPRTTVDEEE